MLTLSNAIYFDRLALFAYSKRCAQLRRQYTTGKIDIDVWNDKRIALDSAYNARLTKIGKLEAYKASLSDKIR